MKWLKLDCDFRNDPKIQALSREWGGQEAAGFWTLLLAFVGSHGGPECKVRIDPFGEISDVYLAKWFGTYPNQILKKLKRAAELSLIELQVEETLTTVRQQLDNSWTTVGSTSNSLPTVVALSSKTVQLSWVISIPKMLKRIDAYSARVRTHFEQSTKKSALEEEVEVEKKKIEERNQGNGDPAAPANSQTPVPIRSRRTPKTSAPTTLPITDAMRRWASDNQIDSNLDAETAAMLDHHGSRGNLHSDWTAAWRSWMRKSKRFDGGLHGKPKETYPERVSRINRETAAVFDRALHDATLDSSGASDPAGPDRALLPGLERSQ